jgi:alkanesulfonate monooxygenase SsuD/methylene tetrahydromethanopterin reductase-like flavin-dependent oxidoreductase (luciferase family)
MQTELHRASCSWELTQGKVVKVRYGIHAPNFGAFGNARDLAEMARDAEEAGWDGFFLWDQLLWTDPINQVTADSWIALAAMATVTERIKLGALVTPMARRRPWKMAREIVTLDHLSGGRMVLGVGLGEDDFREYSAFGEPADYATHAEKLDEGLEIISGLWSGEPFTFEGKHYQVKEVQFLPIPLQRPRIPIWVGGGWPRRRPFRRAARWDGIAPQGIYGPLTPDDVRALIAYINEHRSASGPFDVVYIGNMPEEKAQASSIAAEYEKAGVTWWLEDYKPWSDATVAHVRGKLRNGPPGKQE